MKKKNNDIIAKKAEQYDSLRVEEKTIKSRKDQLSKELKDYASLEGIADDKGSKFVEVGEYTVGVVAKQSLSLDQEKTIQFLKENNFPEAVILTESVDEEKLEALIKLDKIKDSDLEKLLTKKVSHSISVKKNEVMSDVEVHEVGKVASTKSGVKKKSVLKKKKD